MSRSASLAQTLKDATLEGARQARDVVQSCRDGGEALTQLAKRAGGQLDDLKTSVNVQLQELAQLSQQVVNLGQSVRGQLQGQTAEFAAAANAAKASAEAARSEATAASELVRQALGRPDRRRAQAEPGVQGRLGHAGRARVAHDAGRGAGDPARHPCRAELRQADQQPAGLARRRDPAHQRARRPLPAADPGDREVDPGRDGPAGQAAPDHGAHHPRCAS